MELHQNEFLYDCVSRFGWLLGAVLRFFVYEIISKLTYMFGYAFGTQVSSLIATFFVNVVGSFAIGLLFAYVQSGDLKLLSKDIWTHFFDIGLLGAFTTFSTFSYANVLLLQGGLYGQLLLNIIGNVGICLLATFCGFVMYRGS
ncbi:fluoride efflux transporter FluC [Helicobacter equorum]|uniref:fluoride efflux transporter FluC n=1 Tax=Helicobacter equorum TaxID=361872 RepID=UPI000CF173A7|nr:CrcB family protein [Helicobacter equorum]